MGSSDDIFEMELDRQLDAMGSGIIGDQDKMNLFLYRKMNKLCDKQDEDSKEIKKQGEQIQTHLADCKEYREKNDKRLVAVDKVAAKYLVLEERWSLIKSICVVLLSGLVSAFCVWWF